VFVVMEISTRRIVHCNVTESPALDWVKIQIRDIAAFDGKPRFLLHDNDGILGQFGRRRSTFRGVRQTNPVEASKPASTGFLRSD
jgi:hypothetical protein